MQDLRRLDVWERSMVLAGEVYRATAALPKSEVYGLASQVRSAAVSIPSNIAEGCVRDAQGDFARFLRIANGSACELETQLTIAINVDFGDRTRLEFLISKCEELRRMLSVLIQRVTARVSGTVNERL